MVFVLVGPDWLTISDDKGRRLIDLKEDWVRREIIHAFARRAEVVPLLLEGATYPTVSELPRPLRSLAKLHYIEVSTREPIKTFPRLFDYLKRRFPYSEASTTHEFISSVEFENLPPNNIQITSPQAIENVARNVFVIHGRDLEVRDAIFDFLRALDLNPQEWEPLVHSTGSSAPFLLDVISAGMSPQRAQAVVAILTPEDKVALHSDLYEANECYVESSRGMQPRPNVLIELGMALAIFRNRTLLVEFGGLRRISDLEGLNVIKFDNPDIAIAKIAERLKVAGCALKDSGYDWRKTARFSKLKAYERGLQSTLPSVGDAKS